MGVWRAGCFENGSALDLADSLKKGGVTALKKALEPDHVRGLEVVRKFGSVAAIEAIIAAELEQHRAYLAAGLSVGLEADYESRVRKSLMAGLTEPTLGAAQPFAAALEVIAAACGHEADLGNENGAIRWASRNKSKVVAELANFVVAAKKRTGADRCESSAQ